VRKKTFTATDCKIVIFVNASKCHYLELKISTFALKKHVHHCLLSYHNQTSALSCRTITDGELQLVYGRENVYCLKFQRWLSRV